MGLITKIVRVFLNKIYQIKCFREGKVLNIKIK